MGAPGGPTAIRFAVRRDAPDGGALHVIVPLLDDVPMPDVVGRYEARHGLSPAGGYGGIAAESVAPDAAPAYYLGLRGATPDDDPPWWRTVIAARSRRAAPRIQVLACDGCGLHGCWPGEMRVEVGAETVVWRDFGNPRPSWDYTGLGPFVFDRDQYLGALEGLAAQVARLTR